MTDYYMLMCDIESDEKTGSEYDNDELYLYNNQDGDDDDDAWLYYPESKPDAWLKYKGYTEYDEF